MKSEDVKDWLERHRTGDATAPTNCTRWKKHKLWKKDYNDIIEYLKTRYNRSLCPIEYYACKLYLSKTLPEDELYMPFEESLQYQRFTGGTNLLGCEKEVSNQGYSGANQVYTVPKTLYNFESVEVMKNE